MVGRERLSAEADFHIGESRAQRAGEQWQQLVGRRADAADSQSSSPALCHPSGPRARVSHRLQDLVRMVSVGGTGWSEGHPAGRSLEKLKAELGLELTNRARQRWLGRM